MPVRLVRRLLMTTTPHSALYLDDARDLWWNEDFLALMAQRTRLGEARRVLDAGCGKGAWTRIVASLVARGAEVTGVDREQAWVDEARTYPPIDGVTVGYQQGDCTKLAFDDDSFDVVTCQTFLMHVGDPRAVVREMLRVLRPGGRLLLAEPNNLSSSISRFIDGPGFDVDSAVAHFRLEAICEKGKHALGLGFNSLGEGLVGLVDPDVVDDVRVWNNDKCAVFARGEDRSLRREIEDERRRLESGAMTWTKEESRRYFRAGGGDDDEFDSLWQAAFAASQAALRGLENGTLCVNEGGLFYLLSARKR